MADKIFLYWASGSAPCWRIMLALAEKGISGYGNKLVSFDKNEHKSEDILKWNPRGQVPTFVHDNRAINESIAACEYLEKAFAGQGAKLLPDDVAELGFVLQRRSEVQNFEAKLRDCMLYKRQTPAEKFDQEEFKKRLDTFFSELKYWDTYLSKSASGDEASNSFLVGKQLTVADVVFFPFLAFAVRLGLNVEEYPSIARYYQHMVARKSVQDTWPPHWRESDAPFTVFAR